MKHHSLILKVLIVATVAFVLVACHTSKSVTQLVKESKVDTVYLNRIQYDSVFVNNYHLVDRGGDTIIIQDAKVEYRYRLLKDTIKVHQVDSIPVIKEVTVTKTEKYVPWYDKVLCWIGAISLILIIAYIAFRLVKLYLKKGF